MNQTPKPRRKSGPKPDPANAIGDRGAIVVRCTDNELREIQDGLHAMTGIGSGKRSSAKVAQALLVVVRAHAAGRLVIQDE